MQIIGFLDSLVFPFSSFQTGAAWVIKTQVHRVPILSPPLFAWSLDPFIFFVAEGSGFPPNQTNPGKILPTNYNFV